MARRYYKSAAVPTTLSGSLTSGATSVTVGAVTGWPTSYPFTAIIDPDTADEEVVEVTAGPGTSWTITRGVDGTSAVAHNSGAVVKHGVSARDFDEPNAHIAATAGVHGIADASALLTDSETWLGAWTSYTPTLAQGASTDISKTVNYAKYLQIGKLVICQLRLTASAAGTAGSAVTVSLPVTAATSGLIVGVGQYWDVGVAIYQVMPNLVSTSLLDFVRTDTTPGNSIGVDPNIALASTDQIKAAVIYEAA